jgi:uncharacterized protein YgbK (DUF1537 family)
LLLGVIDDDPTGSQAVHGVQVVTVLAEDAYAAALDGAAATCFVLTNTRSLGERAAAGRNTLAARGLIAVARRRGARIQLVSRSDSTLRGHVIAEVAALQAVRREALGRGFDGVLLIPAFLEAGRLTAADIHWARIGPGPVAVGETSTRGIPPSATPHRTCATSSPRRAAGRSGAPMSAASASRTSGSGGPSWSAICWL